MNVGKELITKELREGCIMRWQTQADVEKPLGVLKMRSMLQAQKAVARLSRTSEAGGDTERLGRQWRWRGLWTKRRILECAEYAEDCKAAEDRGGEW